MSADFKDLNRNLLSQAESILYSWFPQGESKSGEFKIGNLYGDKGQSLSVNLRTGVWKDFADGSGGSDLISLYAAHKGLTQIQAYNELGGKKVLTKIPKKKIDQVFYNYTDDYTIIRTDFDDGTKRFSARYKGDNKHHPVPRPLFSPKGITQPRILVVEGEKTALSAIRCLGHKYSVVTWPAGSNGVKSADWSEIPSEADVLIWPDCDDPGYKAAAQISTILRERGCNVSILNVRAKNLFPDVPGWDAHDVCEKYDYNYKKVLEWAKQIKVTPGDIKAPEHKMVENKKVTIEDHAKKMGMDDDNICHLQTLDLLLNSSYKPEPVMANAYKVVERHPAFKNKFYFDTFFNKPLLNDNGVWREIDRADELSVLFFIQNTMKIPKMSDKSVRDALDLVINKNRRSSLADWLKSLEWDGVSRIQDFFLSHIQSEMDLEYLQAVGRNFFISAAARALKPGCQVDNMVVLESKDQGTLKSTAIRVLAGDMFFGSVSSKMDSKDFMENMRGKWLLEMEELSSYLKATPEDQKRLLSTRTDTFRESYARSSKDVLRQSIFVGTTNRDDYIDDRTGARRIWPIEVKYIDLEAIKRDRELLWAEAVSLYQSGHKWWEVPEEAHSPVVDERNKALTDHPWEDVIDDFISNIKDTDNDGYLRISGILSHVLDKDKDKHTRRDSLILARILKDRGYYRKSIRVDSSNVIKAWTNKKHKKEAKYINNFRL